MHVARVALAAGLAIIVGLTVKATQPPDPDDYLLISKDFRDPAHVLDDFHDAAAKADFPRYFSHWTNESVFLGTDARERWVGDEFREFARPYFEQGKGWSYKPRNRKIQHLGEDIAFFDELLHNQKLGTCRGSGILQRIHGDWKILQYNLSIPIPNEKAADVVKLIHAT